MVVVGLAAKMWMIPPPPLLLLPLQEELVAVDSELPVDTTWDEVSPVDMEYDLRLSVRSLQSSRGSSSRRGGVSCLDRC